MAIFNSYVSLPEGSLSSPSLHRHALLFPGVRDQRATAVADVGVVPQRGLRGLQLLQRESHHLDGRLKGYWGSILGTWRCKVHDFFWVATVMVYQL